MARRGPDRIDPRVDALHAMPPDEFVARRDAVARELAAAGDPGAGEVRKLPRPTLPVWAVNLAARREPATTEALLEAGEQVVRAHGIVLGGGSGEELLRANRALGEALERAVASAARLAAESGHRLSLSMSGRVRSTLRSMAVGDAAGRDRLRGGRVSAESAATGLEALGGLSPAPTGASGRHPAARRPQTREPGAHRGKQDGDEGAPRPRPADRREADRDAREREASAARAAREQAARDRAAAAEARRRVRTLERELGRSETGERRLRQDWDAVRRRGEEIEARLRQAEARAAEVRRQLDDARLLLARLQRD